MGTGNVYLQRIGGPDFGEQILNWQNIDDGPDKRFKTTDVAM